MRCWARHAAPRADRRAADAVAQGIRVRWRCADMGCEVFSWVGRVALAASGGTMSDELLPCPFCGCEGTVVQAEGAWIAGCDAGQMRGDDDMTCRANGLGFYHVTRAGAIAAWNRRVAPPAPSEAATLPDTFVERAYQVAQNMADPNVDAIVILSALEASAIRRT